MDGPEKPKSSKAAVLSEQQRKLQELREKRLECSLKNVQDVARSGKKKHKRKRHKKGTNQAPDEPTDRPAADSNQPKHVFTKNLTTANAETTIDTSKSILQPSQSHEGRGEKNLQLVTSTTANCQAARTEEFGYSAPKKKRKKLQWGMEVKERWERKANM